MPVDNSAIAKRILSTLSTAQYLGSSPDLTVRLLMKMKDPAVSIDDIAGLIAVSPTITASLLKLCNSAYYFRGNTIDSVSRAIVHLGLTTVVRFVYAMDMMGVFPGGERVPGFNEATFWKNSLAGAFLAQEIAEKMRFDKEESVFLGGLLRNIGVCVIRQYFPDLFEETWEITGRSGCSFGDACMTLCGLDHQSIAFLLAMRWNLPATVTAIFQPPSSGHEDVKRLILIRNFVEYSDYALRTRNMFAWDPGAHGDDSSAASLFIEAGVMDSLVARVVSDINELHDALH
jgi:HD-like signal output (HDOD) protein